MPRSTARLRRGFVVAPVAALSLGVAGPSYATDIWGAGADGPSEVKVQVDRSEPRSQPATPVQNSNTGSDGPAVSPYPAPGPYGSWDDAFPKNPNADLSWMPGAVDACGSNWGGDGWNAKYAEPTPCAPEDDEEPAAPQITVAMVTAAASAMAPSTPPHVQPGAISYVNIPNNYWADAPTVNNAVTVLGIVIPLRWTPVMTTWDFGDGGTAAGDGIEGARVGAAGAVEHAYRRQGRYAISTTTAYDLTFTLPGAGAQTIRLSAPPSPAVNLPIREIQTRTSYVG